MPDPLSAVAAALAIAKTSLEAVAAIQKKLRGQKVRRAELIEIEESVESIESGLLKTQETILDLKTALVEARQENLDLHDQLSRRDQERRTAERQELERQKYTRVKVGESWIVVEEGTEEPYFCTTCFSRGELIPIQPMGEVLHDIASHSCATCKTTFRLR